MSRAYFRALTKSNEAYRAYHEKLAAYRARKIGDAEIEAARKSHMAARRELAQINATEAV